jgi:hypothetical protein
MAENEHRSPLGTQLEPISVTDIYNSSPSKFQPWMQVTGGIPPKARMCGVDYDSPEADNTHGIPKGGLLIMENAPKGTRPEGNGLFSCLLFDWLLNMLNKN